MKLLKDYLHLYKDCQVKWGSDTVRLVDTDGTNCNLFGDALPTGKHNTSIKNIRPILRPLSDMTEDEEDEMVSTQENLKFREYNLLVDSGETFRYMLSKHFDLFGLIESGLALDATTLKAVTQ